MSPDSAPDARPASRSGTALVLESSGLGVVTSWDPDGGNPFEAMARVPAEVIRFDRERAHVLRAVPEVAAYDEAVRDLWNADLRRPVSRG